MSAFYYFVVKVSMLKLETLSRLYSPVSPRIINTVASQGQWFCRLVNPTPLIQVRVQAGDQVVRRPDVAWIFAYPLYVFVVNVRSYNSQAQVNLYCYQKRNDKCKHTNICLQSPFLDAVM